MQVQKGETPKPHEAAFEAVKTPMPLIELQNVSKFYKWEHNFRIAVQSIDLTIRQGEFVFIIGSSGSGKSTLLKLISGQLDPDWGEVRIDGRELKTKTRFGRRRRINPMFGIVGQKQGLVNRKTVYQNLMDSARQGMRFSLDNRRKAEERIKKVLSLVGMKGFEDKYPLEMSLGECWQVEFARALINSPQILVIDEITTKLDDDTIWDIFLFLNELNRKGTTVIMATRASQFVNIMHKRVVTMVDGKVFGDVKRGRYGDVV